MTTRPKPPDTTLRHTPGRTPSRLLPLGALAAGFGLLQAAALAQTGSPASIPAAPAAAASATPTPKPAAKPAPTPEATMPAIAVKATADTETDANSLRASTSRLAKGDQDLRDIPQSLTVVTDKLITDRRIDTLKEALHQTAGISFQAGEGGEEDVRLRGFSLATTGDIRVDGQRDPAFYERDTFANDRIEVLRGSASMLFGRGSTGGVVNQVSKQAYLDNTGSVDLSLGNAGYVRLTGDVNHRLGNTAALRVNLVGTQASNHGNRIDKQGLAANLRLGIGQADEWSLSAYLLRNDNGIHYGLPWLRASSSQASANPSGLIDGLSPSNYYGAPSDYNAGGAAHATLSHTHRFDGAGVLTTTLRHGRYDRDQRASAIRFCVAPACAGFSTPGASGPVLATAATPLTRGTNNKVQDLNTTTLQSDYNRQLQAGGLVHQLTTGVDLSDEQFTGYALATPDGVVLDKNAVRATLGTPDDGRGWVDETLRIRQRQAGFQARAMGAYVQDLLRLTPTWKLLAGLRLDHVQGRYQTYQTALTTVPAGTTPPPIGSLTGDRSRRDTLWSRRFGVLYQPDDDTSWHLSYGTSFNTSGDTYQYDLPGSNTPPEGSRNIELGGRLDLLQGRLSARMALFHATKTHERNRDSPAGTPLDDYLLSGKRHAAGVELDLAGRLAPGWEVYASYAWIPVARIDAGNADGSTLTGEQVGQRPSMTPRHSGTLWTTWQASTAWRVGAGVNARSSMTPNRNPAGIVAPHYVTADLMAEYSHSPSLGFKLNVLNATNQLYADALYSGHYVPGAARAVQLTVTTRF